MRFEAWGIPFRIHPLTIIAALLACRFGLSLELGATMIALFIHESAHLLAAHALNVEIMRVDLLPFGGAARMINPYALGYGRLAGVALAGPLGNLIGLVVSAALAWTNWVDVYFMLLLIQSNLLLMLFNLLPALPLDGGRILYSVFAGKMGEKRALTIGIWMGRGLAVLLAGLAIAGFWYAKTLNITMLLAAVFLIAASSDERETAKLGRMTSILKVGASKPDPHRLTLIGMDASCSVLDAAKTLRVGNDNLYAIYESGELKCFMEQDELRSRIAQQADGDLTKPILSNVAKKSEGKKYKLCS